PIRRSCCSATSAPSTPTRCAPTWPATSTASRSARTCCATTSAARGGPERPPAHWRASHACRNGPRARDPRRARRGRGLRAGRQPYAGRGVAGLAHYLAVEDGLYARQGLDVTSPNITNPPTLVAAVLGGEAPVASNALEPTI